MTAPPDAIALCNAAVVDRPSENETVVSVGPMGLSVAITVSPSKRLAVPLVA